MTSASPRSTAEAQYCIRQSSGIQEASDHTRLLDGWGLTYEQLSRGRFQGSLNEAWIEGVHLYQETLAQSVFQTGAMRQGCISLGVFASLSGEARWFGKPVTIDDVIFLDSGGELLLSTPKHSTLLVLCLPHPRFTESTERRELHHFVHHPALAQVLRRQIGQALGQLLTQPLRFSRESARRLFCADMQNLADDCLRVASGAPLDACRGRAIQVVHRAMDYMHERRGEMVSIDSLCSATYTSRRNLQKSFVKVTGESPAQFLKAQRLNGVRRDILNAPAGRMIGDIAIDWGFWHVSQFSVDYKRLFGESPSDTVQYARYRKLS
ncbi:AraC family ethanolamine operon transcriptional activator [Variovorax boronicumulans]|uniref:AraC family ethanolamine operon transcriptional activator n=1 Tax=Variovorax boronicumulans TaxID=436515 RepID=A0AAW8DU58_9BURK|nr:helix-turn-helix domain-containing protein [Variovorax boronicumulans]MDP9877442.1 AraC family ethanolamine operon transcriptional activator [Variovorax boronicumulans]MDP9922727.1 AraC family ethanolamine operon transcriptional activator [Variovorax boronicumulans]